MDEASRRFAAYPLLFGMQRTLKHKKHNSLNRSLMGGSTYFRSSFIS